MSSTRPPIFNLKSLEGRLPSRDIVGAHVLQNGTMLVVLRPPRPALQYGPRPIYQRVLANHPEHLARRENESPYRQLTVRVLRARNIRKADTFTESDCYVSISLPTASSETVRTKTVPNSKDPVWNEAFSYRIDSRVKNVVHLGVYDEDTLSKDDELYTIVFDTAKLHVGHTSRVSFKLNPESFEELDVEFTLQNIPCRPEHIVTNGVLVARELSLLEIKVDTEKLKQQYTSGELILTIKGSSEETQKIPLASDSSSSHSNIVEFHCIKNYQSNLEITLPSEWTNLSESPVSLTLPLDHLPLHQKIPIGEDKTFDLQVNARDWKKDLDVRLSYDLCIEEKNFLHKRKKYVAAALKKILQLDEDLEDDEIPVVAIMTTGGGTRSFTAMYGSLIGLQKMNLLDCITYISGLSGTTWTMAKLYEDADWSQKYLEAALDVARKEVTKCKFNCFSMDYLKYYYNALKERTEEGHDTSFIDLWGLVIEAMIHEERDNHTLTDQQLAVNEGQNPFPIYVAINLKEDYSAQDFKEWLEFTPYEVGNFRYGAYIRAEDFASKFFNGRLVNKLPETRITFLIGMWSSIFSMDFMFFWNMARDSEDFWHRWTRDRIWDIEDSLPPKKPHELETQLITPQSPFSVAIRDVLTGRPTITECPNFMKGFQLDDKYLEHEQFSTWKDTVLDCHPNKLMETAGQTLQLVDTGFFINTSNPPLLRPERKVDLMLHLNYSGGPQTLNLDKFAKYVIDQGIPFPKTEIDPEEKKNLKECYVFEDKDNEAAPVVLFFPLVNDTYQKYKAPGVERSPEEMKEGDIDVRTFFSPFTTREIRFSEDNFNRLTTLMEYNVLNNEDKIIEALRAAVQKKKQQKLIRNRNFKQDH